MTHPIRPAVLSLLLFLCASAFARDNRPDGFIENKGQVVDQNGEPNSEVLFILPQKGYNVELRRDGYSYDMFSVTGAPPSTPSRYKGEELLKTKISAERIDITFKDASPLIEVEKGEASADFTNYFLDGRSVPDVRSFSKVIYHNVYPLTDVEFCTDSKGSFKYNIILHPGADIHRIKMLIKGQRDAEYRNGNLVLSTSIGSIGENIPRSYYTNAPDHNIPVQFYFYDDEVVFFSATHDPSRTLIIDPTSNRLWGTYYGDAGTDYCSSTGSDAASNIYISGYTLSTNNIATNGTYQSTLYASFDVYLVKFNANGQRLWGSYFGGNSVDAAYGMYVEANGNVYLCGDTFSTINVASTGAHQTTYGGGIDDALLVKFDPNGQRKWSTYYGGTLHDIAFAVTTDNNGRVIITGHTESSASIATNGSYQNFNGGAFDVFIAVFDSLGTRQWGTYYGDTQTEEGLAVACDQVNNIYVTGFTLSGFNIATNGSHQSSIGGQQDGFIAKFNPAGTSLLWATYYGGGGNDQCTTIRIGNGGSLFVGGNTASVFNISTPGCYQFLPGSADDGFLVNFNSSGVRQWGTYVGGNNVDYIEELVFDANMKLVVCGSSQSTNAISTAGAWQPNNSSPNNYDAFVMRFKNTGALELGTYYGGSYADYARGITLDNSGKVYLCGESDSQDSIATPGSHQPVPGGGTDGFLAKFCLAGIPGISPSGTVTLCEGDSLVLTSVGSWSSYLWSDGSTADTAYLPPTTLAGTYYYTLTTTDAYGCGATSDTTTIVVDVCNSVASFASDQSIEVFPVPASDFLEIKVPGWNEGGTISLLDVSGRLLLQRTVAGPVTSIPVKELPPGTYILRAEVNKQFYERKILKE